jgi:hypothetical protein
MFTNLILLFSNQSASTATAPVPLIGNNLLLLFGQKSNIAYPDGILEGIRQFFLSDSEMVAKFTGGIYLHDMPVGSPLPTLVVDSLTSVPHFSTSGPYFTVDAVTFSIWHTDADEARKAGVLLKRKFDRTLSIQLQDAIVTTFYRKREMLVGSDVRGPNDQRMYQLVIDYHAYTSMNLNT